MINVPKIYDFVEILGPKLMDVGEFFHSIKVVTKKELLIQRIKEAGDFTFI
jgi:hypothetical protein